MRWCGKPHPRKASTASAAHRASFGLGVRRNRNPSLTLPCSLRRRPCMRVHATAARCASHFHPRPRWPRSATARCAGAAVARGCTSRSAPSGSPATRSRLKRTFGVTGRYATSAASIAVASPTGSLFRLSLEPGTASTSATSDPNSLPQCVSVASTELTRGGSSTSRPRSVGWVRSVTWLFAQADRAGGRFRCNHALRPARPLCLGSGHTQASRPRSNSRQEHRGQFGFDPQSCCWTIVSFQAAVRLLQGVMPKATPARSARWPTARCIGSSRTFLRASNWYRPSRAPRARCVIASGRTIGRWSTTSTRADEARGGPPRACQRSSDLPTRACIATRAGRQGNEDHTRVAGNGPWAAGWLRHAGCSSDAGQACSRRRLGSEVGRAVQDNAGGTAGAIGSSHAGWNPARQPGSELDHGVGTISQVYRCPGR